MIELKVPASDIVSRRMMADITAELVDSNTLFSSLLDASEEPVVAVTSRGMSIFVSSDSPIGVDIARESECSLDYNFLELPMTQVIEDREPLIRVA